MRPGPHHIGTSGASDGDALLYDAATDEFGPGAIPASGVQSVTAGTYIKVDDTDPLNVIITAMVPLTTKVGGVPQLVFDTDGHLIYTEAP